MAAAAPLEFTHGFRLTRRPFCFDIDIGRLGIEFRLGRKNFYLFLAVGCGFGVAVAGGRPAFPSSGSTLANAERLGLGSPAKRNLNAPLLFDPGCPFVLT